MIATTLLTVNHRQRVVRIHAGCRDASKHGPKDRWLGAWSLIGESAAGQPRQLEIAGQPPPTQRGLLRRDPPTPALRRVPGATRQPGLAPGSGRRAVSTLEI